MLRRGAALLFTIDEFDGVLERLIKAEVEFDKVLAGDRIKSHFQDLEQSAGFPMSATDLCNMASVYWELGNEEKAVEYEERIRQSKVECLLYSILL